MATHQVIARRFPVVHGRTACLLIATLSAALLIAQPALAQKQTPAPKKTAAAATRVLLFNLTPAGTYEINKNGSALDSRTGSPSGVISFRDVTNTGDAYLITLTGIDPVDPAIPTGFSAQGSDVGCAVLIWATPDADEYVFEYSIQWGTTSGAPTDSMLASVGNMSVTGAITVYSKCGLPDGAYYFSLRAHNQFDRWSALSSETLVTVSNGQTQGPTAPQDVNVREDDFGCATVSWRAVGDPTVTGYTVYYGDQSVVGGQADDYPHNIDVGNNTSRVMCDFTEGRYYFAVKAYTAVGVTSIYSAEKSIDMVGPDLEAPVFTGFQPPNAATDVARNTRIFVNIGDTKSGVDANSISIRINGTLVPSFSVLGTPAAYTILCGQSSDLPADQDITVEVSASDLTDPANTASTSWSFRTGGGVITDTTPPGFDTPNPAPNALGVDGGSDIEIVVTDPDLGVDVGSLELYVNGAPASFSTSGTPFAVTLHYQNSSGFLPGSTVNVRVVACDVVGNCGELNYAFTVQADFSVLAYGVIVPDGYWVNAPSRPLEVRNLPLSWTVRIFDTSGHLVRRFRNEVGDGFTFNWEFRNDSGMPVARALYLVRVTDAQGALKQSGRFLVQQDP